MPGNDSRNLFTVIPGGARATPSRDPDVTAGVALANAARELQPLLDAGTALSAAVVTSAVESEWTALPEPAPRWTSKSLYDAAEAAVALFLTRWAQALRKSAPTPARFLPLIERIAGLEPTHTHRSEHQVAYDQFSSPLALAFAATVAADVRPADTVLEPSAGTGVLACLAATLLDRPGQLHLNELAPVRRQLLQQTFPRASVTGHNAEQIRDRLPQLRPHVVLMNPPFAARPTAGRKKRHVDIVHLRSAYAALAVGGRLVAITGRNCIPGSAPWLKAFGSDERSPRILANARIPREIYQPRGTSVETRLIVLEKAPDADPDRYPADASGDNFALVDDVADLLDRIADLPERLADARAACQIRLETPTNGITSPNDARNGSWTPWRPTTFRFPGADEHPTPLVESAAMADIPLPVPSTPPFLPRHLVDDSLLSRAQLESIALAVTAHQRHLPTAHRIAGDWTRSIALDADGELPDNVLIDVPLSAPVHFRQGWMLGDGTGCGKGRQIAALILDRWLQGTRRAVWISQSSRLVDDARRDWRELGQHEADVFPLSDYRPSQPIARSTGILFTTYATLRSPGRNGSPSRLEQIVHWLAGGRDEAQLQTFDGIIAFDEAHAMANAAGTTTSRGEAKPSQQGLAGLRLQNALPDARILYVSATGASTINGLAYASRLGLWSGDATAFGSRDDFVSAMDKGGVAAMEIVARDLKALGLYHARALAYHGVEIDLLEHPLTEPQTAIWDAYAGAFHIIHQHIEAALEATGVTSDGETLSPGAKSAALSAFEQTKQRFFSHLLSSMKCPTLIRAIEADLAAGHAPVVQLVSTGEALLDRRLAEVPPGEHDDLSVDLTPREYVMEYLARSFPTALHEETVDDAGNTVSTIARDDDGNPVESQEAVAMRDQLLEELGALPPMPAALDILLHHFGHERIAEVTGRSRRILRHTDSRGTRHAVSTRPANANAAEATAFMDGDKQILVFSTAGGTGRSYHADTACQNQARRIHYLLEAGWRADVAIQGLGRTHRTRQASAPVFRPVTTDVRGERRFIATIARRLDSLGAITRGQRDSQTSMGDDSLFRPEDNLESQHALTALRLFLISIHYGHVPDWPEERFTDATGLRLSDSEGGLRDSLPPMPRFLNRLLALPIDQQNELFGHFQAGLDGIIQAAREAGTYHEGVEAIHADSLTVAERHPGPVDTEILRIARRDAIQPLTADQALHIVRTADSAGAIVINDASGRPAIATPAPSAVNDDGSILPRLRLRRPNDNAILDRPAFDASRWRPADETHWRALWQAEIEQLPATRETHFHLITGRLLGAWHLLPDDHPRVRRLTTDAGERLIGRVLDTHDAARLLAASAPGAFHLEPADIIAAVLHQNARFGLANGWRLVRRTVLGSARVELQGPDSRHLQQLKALAVPTEIISWTTRFFVEDPRILGRVLDHFPLHHDGANPPA